MTVHIFFNLQNHPTFQTEERLVNLVNGRECFVGLLYSVQYLRSYILLVYDVISLLLLGIMSVDTSSVCDCFLLNIFMPYSPWLISNYTHTHMRLYRMWLKNRKCMNSFRSGSVITGFTSGGGWQLKNYSILMGNQKNVIHCLKVVISSSHIVPLNWLCPRAVVVPSRMHIYICKRLSQLLQIFALQQCNVDTIPAGKYRMGHCCC